MKIGLQIPSFTWPGGPAQLAPQLEAIARSADEGGFASLWVMDHFFQIPPVGRAELEMLEGWSTLVLVKTATTLDVLSGGRAWLGIGAAWFEREHLGLGVPYPAMAERFECLEETLRIAHQMWSSNDGPFEGRDYADVEKTTLGTVHLAPGKTSAPELVRHCRGLADLGIDQAIFNLPNVHQRTPVETIAKEVIPAVAEF